MSIAGIEMYTSHTPCRAQSMDYKGIIVVNKVKSRNVFYDCATCLKSCVGGEIKNLTKLTSDLRQELLAEVASQAQHLGANAVIGINFQTNTIFEGTLDMVVYGTAVKYSKEEA